MKNWYSKLLAETNPSGRAVFHLIAVGLGVTLISLPIYTIIAIQTGQWQMYAIQGGLVVFLLINLAAAHQARRNHAELAASMLIGASFFIIPFVVAFMAGLGLLMSLTLFFTIAALVGQTLSGRAAVRAIILAAVIASATLVLDLFASWERLAIPVLQSYGSIITALALILFVFITLRQFPTYSMRVKTVIALVLAALISIASVSVVTNRILVSQINTQSGTNLSEIAQSVSFQIGNTVGQYRNVLESLAINDLLQEIVETANTDAAPSESAWKQMDDQWKSASDDDAVIQQVTDNQLAEELREFRSRLPELAEVFVTDQYGQVLAATDRTSDYYQADEEWWQSAWANGEGNVYIGQPTYDESSKVYAIDIAIPITNNDNDTNIGVLRATLDANQFKEILASGKLGETGNADLVFSESQFIGEEIKTGFGSFDPETASNLSAIRDETYGLFSYEDVPSLVSIAPVKFPLFLYPSAVNELNWKVVVHQSQQEVQQPVTVATRAILLLANGLLIVIGLLAFYFGSFFTKPLEELTAIALLVTKGDLNVRAPETSKDETGTLARTFNAMTVQLRELIGSLEQRVADRTKALATSGEISRRLSTITEQQQLVSEVVEQLQSAFHYYHVHIYMMDDANEFLELAGGTGEAGKMLLERGHRLPRGRGLVGRAADSAQSIVVPDTRQDPNWLPNPLLPETRSEIAVPITTGHGVVGVLDVQNNVSDSLTQQDAELIQSIASQVAIALQNIRSAENVAKRAKELASVAEISNISAREIDVEKMLTAVVHQTQRLFGLYHAHVFLYDESAAELHIVACGWQEGDIHEGTQETTVIPLNQEQSLVARAARTRQAVIVNNVRIESGWLPNPLLLDTVSEMAVPLLVGDRMLGVLDVQSDRLNAFTEEDAYIQKTLASQVATSLQNARTFSQSRKQAERESTLNVIGQRIQRTTSIDAALKIAVRELGHALGMKPTLVTLEPENLNGEREIDS